MTKSSRPGSIAPDAGVLGQGRARYHRFRAPVISVSGTVRGTVQPRPRLLRVLVAGMLAASFLDNYSISHIPFLHNVASVLGVLLLLGFVVLRGKSARLFDRPGRYVVVFILVTVIVEIARIFFGGSAEGVFAFRVYLQYVQVAVLFLIVFDLACDPRTVKWMFAAFLFSTFMMSLAANLRLEWLTETSYDQRVGVIGLNLNDQAFMYALGVVGVMCWILIRWPRFGFRELTLCAVAGSMMFALVDTGSRGGAASLLVGVAVALVLLLRRGRYSAYFTVVPLIIAGIAIVLLGAEVLRERTEATVARGDTGHRVELATAGSELFVERPVFGWGAQYSHDLGIFMQKGRAIAAHNLYIQMLLSFGLVGFLPWLFAVLGSLGIVWRVRWSAWGATLLTLWLMTLAFAAVGNLGYDKTFWLLMALVSRAGVVVGASTASRGKRRARFKRNGIRDFRSGNPAPLATGFQPAGSFRGQPMLSKQDRFLFRR